MQRGARKLSKLWWDRFRIWLARRNAIAVLRGLDDRMLEDVGMHRSEIASTIMNAGEERRRKPDFRIDSSSSPDWTGWPVLVIGLIGATALILWTGSHTAPESLVDELVKRVPTMQVRIADIDRNGRLSDRHAACQLNEDGGVSAGPNAAIEVRWSDAPVETRSFVVVMIDRDAPVERIVARLSANKSSDFVGRLRDRRVLYHWIVVDIPSEVRALIPPSAAAAQTAGDSSRWRFGYSDVARMMPSAVGWAGYSGPCPAVEDGLVHRYEVHVFALDTPVIELNSPNLFGRHVFKRVAQHALAHGVARASYSLNPNR